ncbi:hypothetical protein ACFWXK_20990 [Streptomyces sp. NPDC059070]|uniref:hypothetical protein n=1 Tax=Streptomyces sp. NPDC059070 TaxID=3346713 RepID=UPI00369BC55A
MHSLASPDRGTGYESRNIVYETCWAGEPRDPDGEHDSYGEGGVRGEDDPPGAGWPHGAGGLLFGALATAQRQAEHAYLLTCGGPGGTPPADGGPGRLLWSRQDPHAARPYETWTLFDSGERTPVSIRARPVHDGAVLPTTGTAWQPGSPQPCPPPRPRRGGRAVHGRASPEYRALTPSGAARGAASAGPYGFRAPAVSSVEELLGRLRDHPGLSELMYALCGFDLSCRDHGEVLTSSSGEPVEGFAGDDVGGTYFLYGDPDEVPAVVYASPEGEGGLIADSLGDALRVIIGLPGWQDCLRFSAGGSLTAMRAAAAYLENDLRRVEPHLTARRAHLAGALSLGLPPAHLLLARLQDAVSRTTPSYVLRTARGDTYTSLFGTLTPMDNPGWCGP